MHDEGDDNAGRGLDKVGNAPDHGHVSIDCTKPFVLPHRLERRRVRRVAAAGELPTVACAFYGYA